MDEITLLKFPFPYKAALTICSDIDGTSWKHFLTIHQFLNSERSTILGKGLKLSIGDSFWMYDTPGIPNSAFSYFKNANGEKSPQAPMIKELIKAGVLDVLHGYGNFESPIEFSRDLSERAIEELEKNGLKIKVWTNHGGIESVQNIGRRSRGMGDINDPEIDKHHFYHTDLLISYGIKFYWDSEAAVTKVVGQERKVKFSEAYWKSPLVNDYRAKLKMLAKGVISLADNVLSKLTNTHFVPWQLFDPQNRLLDSDQLRDGKSIFRFKRFGNGRFDWSEDLPFLLNDQVLSELIKREGHLVLYIHLGDRREKKEKVPLSKETVEKLNQISDLFKSGALWVDTTSRLLTYNLIRRFIDWEVVETSGLIKIVIHGLKNCPVKTNLSATELNGLSFRINTSKNVKIFFRNKEIPSKTIYQNEHKVLMIPLTFIEWPL